MILDVNRMWSKNRDHYPRLGYVLSLLISEVGWVHPL